VITSNLDVLNLNASKPSLNKKEDFSFDASLAGEFGQELAAFQNDAFQKSEEQALSQNISLMAAELPNMNGPNQVSADNVKTLTENLNNFSGLQTALPGFGEAVVKDLGEEEQNFVMAPNAEVAQAMAGLNLQAGLNPQNVAAPQMAAASVEAAAPTVQNFSSVVPQAAVPQMGPQLNQQINPQANLQPNVQNSPQLPLAESATGPKQQLSKEAVVAETNLNESVSSDANGIVPLMMNAAPKMGVEAQAKMPKGIQQPARQNLAGTIPLDGFEQVSAQEAPLAMPDIQAAMNGANEAPATDKQISEEIQKQSFDSVMPKTAGNSLLESLSQLQNQGLKPLNTSGPAVAMDVSAKPDMMPMMAMMPQGQNQTKNEFGDSKDFSSKDQDRSAELGMDTNFNHISEKHKLTDPQVKNLEVQTPAPTEAQHKANMDQIITHARTFLKDGGGEMVMKLTPEGMGTVDLRVGVKDGLVSIEINTQNEHVKKMFEEGAKDIRGALELQNLKVDHLRVNVADNVNKNMNPGQFNMSDKDFARNFMGQFRDERNGFRNQALTGVMDKFQSPAKEPAGLRPAGMSMSGNGMGRLNVIA
jgi:hypothetical protein